MNGANECEFWQRECELLKISSRDVQMLGAPTVGRKMAQNDVPLGQREVEEVVSPQLGVVVPRHQQEHHWVYPVADQMSTRSQTELVET